MPSTTAMRTGTQQRRRQILDAALACFLRQGVDATTIEQICAESGASIGSVYHHFGSKSAVALALYEAGMEEYCTLVRACFQKNSDPEAGIRAVIAAHLSWTVEKPELSLYLTRFSMSELPDEIAQRVGVIYRSLFDSFQEWLQPHVEKGTVIRVRPDLYYPMIMGPTVYFARQWLVHRVVDGMGGVADSLAAGAWNSIRCVSASNRRSR